MLTTNSSGLWAGPRRGGLASVARRSPRLRVVSAPSAFAGFSAEGLSFLTTLGAKNKEWFDSNRAEYQKAVVAPAKVFVVAMGGALAAGSYPLIEALPKVNGSMAPINNDLRFKPDASPYKDHLMFKFWEGPDKKTAPTLWVRMHPTDGIGFASGMAFPDLDRWRTSIDRRGESFAAAVEALQVEQGADLVADGLKRVPKPYPTDHPRELLLRAKGFQVRWVKATPTEISSAAFVDVCVTELERLSAVHHWLAEHLL